MAERLDEKEVASFEELLRPNMIDAVTQLLVERGGSCTQTEQT